MKLAVDIVVKRGAEILVIKRKFPPFQDKYALPGGFVEEHETMRQAAARELKEETGLDIPTHQLKLIGLFDRVETVIRVSGWWRSAISPRSELASRPRLAMMPPKCCGYR